MKMIEKQTSADEGGGNNRTVLSPSVVEDHKLKEKNRAETK